MKIPWNKGKKGLVKHSILTREKMRLSHLGKNTWSKGRKLTEAHKEKIRNACRGGNSTSFKKGQKINLGRKHSEEIILKQSLSHIGKMTGENHHNWKGGISPIHAKIRSSPEYKFWRKLVFKRDNYTCVWCKARCGNGKKVILNADHLKPFSIFPELRFNVDNGRTLCIECHKKTSTYGNKINNLK